MPGWLKIEQAIDVPCEMLDWLTGRDGEAMNSEIFTKCGRGSVLTAAHVAIAGWIAFLQKSPRVARLPKSFASSCATGEASD